MDKNNVTSLRQQLEQMPTQALAEKIHEETEKETPDDDLVLLILSVLEERNAEEAVELGPEGEAAWEKFREKKLGLKKRKSHWLRVAAAASFAAVFLLVVSVIPVSANAGSFWKILANWTDSIFEYVNIGGRKEPEEYVFRTDNPGLQEVYDTVVSELGVTVPVVPQWLPEGYELSGIERMDSPAKISLYATFEKGENEAVLLFDRMKQDFSSQYVKSASQVNEYETNGIIHHIMQNGDEMIASWIQANMKCAIYINCQEEDLKNIIKSIYIWEECA